VTVCPVSCFHGDDEMLYVDQGVCIDCKACIPACPVGAILDFDELPEGKEEWLTINAEKAPVLPQVFEKQNPLPTAEARARELGKL
jgi:ferredoxin